MPIRYVVNRVKRFFIFRVLHVNDTPHRIALGVAIGIFVTWTPTIGFQMLLTVALAWLLRANKLVGVPFVWISNPLTMVPIYLPNFALGRWLLRNNYESPDFAKALTVGGGSWLEAWLNRTSAWWSETMKVFAPLWLGSLIVGLVLGVTTYFLIRYAVVAYRRHREHVRQLRRQRRANAIRESPDEA